MFNGNEILFQNKYMQMIIVVYKKQNSRSKINPLKKKEEKTNWQFTSSKNVYENNFFGITQKHILQFSEKS